ncbi:MULTISPECIES: hypothetical protein [unclassified Pseudomonas]|uniref:hypothetical protein n=1 Tax=unclassified Pseudomonas TaxID=196821 RepID=UPI00128AED28|nr:MULTISPECIES: hypothetical protein [unclassified Pseudomonas]MPQ67801.1 hypothetical protein [Pseudomonas sp. MWU12-2323]
MKSLEKYAKKMASDWDRVLVRRVMWIDMEERIRRIFRDVEGSPYANEFGALFILNGIHEDAKEFYITQRLNQIQIGCGTRFLGLNAIDIEDEKPKKKVRFEKGAALWFSQSPTGGVTVFMSPYSSDVVTMTEDNIIIGMYKEPSRLTEREIYKIFSKFFKYLSITSALHPHTSLDYVWRLWLIYFDARSKRFGTLFNSLDRVIIFGGAFVTVCAFIIQALKS